MQPQVARFLCAGKMMFGNLRLLPGGLDAVLRSPRIEPKPKVPALACYLVPLIGAQTGSTTRVQSELGYNDLYLCGHFTVALHCYF